MYPERRGTNLGASTGLLGVMSLRSLPEFRLSASGLLPSGFPLTPLAPYLLLTVRLTRDHPRCPDRRSPLPAPRARTRADAYPVRVPKRRRDWRGREDETEGRERGSDTPGEKNKKKSRGRVRTRRVAPSFLRPGTSERRTPRLREPVCGAVFTGRDGRAAREAIPFPTVWTFEWCARLFAVLVATARSSGFSARAGIRPRRSIRLEHGTPANGGVR